MQYNAENGAIICLLKGTSYPVASCCLLGLWFTGKKYEMLCDAVGTAQVLLAIYMLGSANARYSNSAKLTVCCLIVTCTFVWVALVMVHEMVRQEHQARFK